MSFRRPRQPRLELYGEEEDGRECAVDLRGRGAATVHGWTVDGRGRRVISRSADAEIARSADAAAGAAS
jgi:hypothetical protein